MIPDCIIHWTWQDRLQLLSSSSFKNTMYYRHIEVLSISLAHEYQKSYMHVSNCRPQYSEECHCIRGQNVLFPREDAPAFSTHKEWCRQSIVLPDRLARRTLSPYNLRASHACTMHIPSWTSLEPGVYAPHQHATTVPLPTLLIGYQSPRNHSRRPTDVRCENTTRPRKRVSYTTQM